MTFLYTIRGRYDSGYDNEDIISWENYIRWSKLTHLTELVSLDAMLNELLVEPDLNNDEDWDHIFLDDLMDTGFYKTLEYALSRTKQKGKFNLLTVVIEPDQDCKLVQLDNYDFIGYDLLDQYYTTSAITNCGGFDEVFLPSDLNNFGLIDDYNKAFDIKKRLFESKPEEEHADTNVIAVWRHQIIGR
jgi:hypothetical protein